MRKTNRKYTMNCIKTTTAIITIVVLVALSVLPSFGIPDQTGGTFGGSEYLLYSRPSLGSVNDLATAVQNQIYFTNPMAYGSTYLHPICITIRPLYDQWRITVIVHRGSSNSAPSVTDIPEEWGISGATLHFDKAGNLYRYDWMIKGKGGLHCQQSVSMTMVDGVYTYKLYTNEQIMYMYKGVGSGLNDQFQFGNATIGSVDMWNNAMSAYDNGLGMGGGFTQDDLDDAYDDGYMDGEQSGYHQGAQDGYANGYANGYDEGYSFSAGAEEIESAYEDGKADGLVEGYQNGKSDGVTEGYTNGYTAGYDKGYAEGLEEGTASEEEIESAYEDGKADGITEGYQTGKADGVAEGYANGYDVGYDNGLETGYADGKADGITEGYQTGKADGVAEGYANGYDVGYDNGLETGYADGKADGITEGYQTGKADGVAEGYANGYDAGYDTGYETGYDDGYDYGYNLGESVGSTKIDIGEIISAVPEGAKSIINGALGFEVFGINVAGTLTALLVVAIVAYVVRKLMSR